MGGRWTRDNMRYEHPAIQLARGCRCYRQTVACFVAVLFIAGCVTLPGKPVPEARLTEIKTVAIVTLALSHLNVCNTTPFSIPPYKGTIDVPEVALEESMTQKL